jgi:hypothetical protein
VKKQVAFIREERTFPIIEKRGVMNPVFEEEKVPVTGTPVWLKRTLLTLLFISAVAGFIFSALVVRQTAAGFSANIIGNPAVETRINDLHAFFEKSVPEPSSGGLLCQGIIRTATRGNRVVFNGEAFEAGATVNGIKILEITASNVLVECNGTITPLVPGESYTPENR